MFGKDVMVLKRELPDGFVEAGQEVSFCLEEGRNGLLATRLTLANALTAEDEQRHRGVIKSFNPGKGWGFVTSPDILSIYGKDIMVRAKDVPNGHIDQGVEVSFVVEDGLTGPIATRLKIGGRGKVR